jgi:hypothetical protein
MNAPDYFIIVKCARGGAAQTSLKGDNALTNGVWRALRDGGWCLPLHSTALRPMR